MLEVNEDSCILNPMARGAMPLDLSMQDSYPMASTQGEDMLPMIERKFVPEQKPLANFASPMKQRKLYN